MMMRRGLYLPIFAHLEFLYLLCINSLQSDLDTGASMKKNIKYDIQITFYMTFKTSDFRGVSIKDFEGDFEGYSKESSGDCLRGTWK